MTMPELMEQTTDHLKRAYAEFIDIAAHDLDAPLRKLTVLIERVTHEKKQDESLQPYINRINSCINDMRAIIDGLVSLSRTLTDKLEIKSTDLAKLIEGIKDETALLPKNRVVRIESGNLPVVEGDEGQLCLLFKHLVENSIRFNTNQEVMITLSSEKATAGELVEKGLDPAKAYEKITISDNGIGFSQEYATKIFEPFVRLHGKSEYPGKGLGLAVCKKIVENHNGTIEATSSENKGARFIVFLPYKHS